MSKKKRKNLKQLFSGKEIEKPERKPKRKSNKGCYITPEELGKLVGEYHKKCLSKDTECILKKSCQNYTGDNCYCSTHKLVKVDDRLAIEIYNLAQRIARIRSFMKDDSVVNKDLSEDLAQHGFTVACEKLRNMMRGDLDSSFSYLTTLIKNAYRKKLKLEHLQEAIIVKNDKDYLGDLKYGKE